MGLIFTIYIIMSIIFIAWMYYGSKNDFLFDEKIEKKIGVWGLKFLTILFLPVLNLTLFYFWNFIEVEQYGCKSKKH